MIKFLADSSINLTKEFVNKYDITILPLYTRLDDIEREEGFEDSWDEFFNALKTSKNFPKTSQPSLELYEKLFDLYTKDNNQVILFTLSKSLSGTYETANNIAQKYKNQVFVVDTTQVCQSSQLLIEEALQLRDANVSAENIVKKCNELTSKISISFVPQTMEYLKRGGRIGKISAIIANVLNIKPILSFKNGVLTCYKKVIGMQKAISELIASIPKTVKKIFVCYIHESKFIKELEDKTKQAFANTDVNIRVGKIGPVVGSHIGIGAIGLAYIDK